jgi:hypothetical protein
MTAGQVPAHDADPLAAALAYAARGLRVLPILPGAKRPPMAAWQDAATTDPDTITSWFTGLYRDHGVGIATGPASGVWALDVDDYEAYRDLERAHQPLPDTLTNLTGSGGMHFLYRYPTDGRTIRNSASTRLGPGLDVRGDGGQIVAPPTVHPNGKRYEWDAGQGDTIVDAPEWLLELVCDQPPTPAPITLADPRLADHVRPGDALDAVDWADLLVTDGWQLSHTDRRTGERHWTRPGKTTRDGTSATTGYTPNDNLKVFTSSMQHAGLQPEETYTKLGYWAATRHHGDHQAAAADLRQRGYGTPTAAPAPSTASAAPTALHDQDADLELHGHGWEPLDLTDVLTGTWQPPTPTMLTRTDGIGLIYPGRVHSIAGEPGGGKTWLALHLAAETIRHGHRALVIDYEDTPSSCVARLRALGLDDAQIAGQLLYVRPERPLVGRGRHNVAALDEIAGWDIALAVIDSVGESIATEGLKPNDDDDVVRWMQTLPRRLAHHNGAAVLLLDHVAKEREGRGLWAIGSQRKLAAIDGAAYMLEVGVAPTRTVDGHVRLICAKDRHGTHQRGHQVAQVDITPTGEHTTITVHPPAGATGEPFRPTVLMERVSRYLEEHGPCSKRETLRNVEGKDKPLGQAIDVLVAEDYVEQLPRKARGGGWELTSINPFRDDEITPADDVIHSHEGGEGLWKTPSDNRGPTAANRGPAAVPGTPSEPRPDPAENPRGVPPGPRFTTPGMAGVDESPHEPRPDGQPRPTQLNADEPRPDPLDLTEF